MLPWIDYGGRFSPLRAAVFAALFLPGLYTAVLFSLGWLGARPVTEAIHNMGFWTIRLMFLALAITPARQILGWRRLIEVRRMTGVAAAIYILIHFVLYNADEAWDLKTVGSEIVLRIYLTIGFTALIGLAVLAATSTDGMVRRLGRRWQRLHYLLYLIAFLALIHFFMQSKADVWEPTWMAGLYLWLMGWRILDRWTRRGQMMPLWRLAALGIAATTLTALGEAAYWWVLRGVPVGRVLESNFTTLLGVRPSWIVLGASLAAFLAAAVRRLIPSPSPARSRASAARGV
jgi:methionine sulfoxide reductase heme-binding subunit